MKDPTDAATLKRLEFDLFDVAPSSFSTERHGPFALTYNRKFRYAEAALAERRATDDAIAAGLRQVSDRVRDIDCELEFAFNERMWPNLADALAATELVLDKREPLLVCTPDALAPKSAPHVRTEILGGMSPPSQFDAFNDVIAENMARPRPLPLEVTLATLVEASSCRAIVAWLDDLPVGTGYSWLDRGRVEITRMHTLQAARRRGVASAVVSALITDAFERGGDLAWLTASGRPAQALYEKVGFRSLGQRLFYTIAATA